MESTRSHTFSIGEAVAYGWETFKKNYKFLIFTVLIIAVISIVFSAVENMLTGNPANRSGFESLVYFIMEIISTIIQLIFSIGLVRIALSFLDGKKPQYAYLWDNWGPKVWKLFLSSLVFIIIVFVGLILLVIPGIVLGLMLQYYVYFIVEKDMGPIEALKASHKLTRGNLWNLFFLTIVSIGIVLLGALALVVGLLVAYPVILMMHAYVYRKLSGGHISEPKNISSDVSFATKVT